MAKMEVLHLTPTQRGELHAYLRKRNLPASVAQRMRIVLLLDEGAPLEEEGKAPPPKIRVVQNWYEEFRGREQD